MLSILKAAYPNFYRDMSKRDLEGIVSLWSAMFRDDRAEDIAEAVKDYICTDNRGFPPDIGAIKERTKSGKAFYLTSVEEDWRQMVLAAGWDPEEHRLSGDSFRPALDKSQLNAF